jgi:hypothetical protein
MNKPENWDALSEEFRPNTSSVCIVEWPRFDVLTDRDLSMLGEARHKTIGGRGVVGRLIDKATR